MAITVRNATQADAPEVERIGAAMSWGPTQWLHMPHYAWLLGTDSPCAIAVDSSKGTVGFAISRGALDGLMVIWIGVDAKGGNFATIARLMITWLQQHSPTGVLYGNVGNGDECAVERHYYQQAGCTLTDLGNGASLVRAPAGLAFP